MGGSNPIGITGTENLGWDQPAADADDLSTIGYQIFIDGQGSPVDGQCETTPTPAGFACKTPLPRMTPGAHAIELASYYKSTPDVLSARAGPLNVTVRALVTGDPETSRSTARSAGRTPVTADEGWPPGTRTVARGLDRASDLAFTPDQRLLVTERSGHVRVFRNGGLLEQPALTLAASGAGAGAILSLAVDPAFARNGFVYAIATAQARTGLEFTLVRFREAGDTLADAVVVLDRVPASIDARAILRFGLDGKLYAAFDAGGDQRAAADPASFNGKVLRINPDGTTPDDAPRKSPILLEGIDSPRGLGWHAPTRHLWVATSTQVDAVRWPSAPNALATVGDDLYVASEAGLARATLDRTAAGRIAGAEDLFSGLPVRAVAARGDGVVFFATDDALGVVERK
jgi:hypothetical protein